MTTEERIQLLEITRRKGNELIDELIAFLRSGGSGCDPQFAAPPAQRDRRAPPTLDESLTGSWVEFGRSAAESYRWPDGRVENYQLFVSYRGADGFKGFTLALGHLASGEVVGFVRGAKSSAKRGLVTFFPADDFEETRERVSLIRGGGETGRGGFAPGEALPKAYQSLKTGVLRNRVAGKWNVQAVVATEDDDATMLAHTALQARLRGLA